MKTRSSDVILKAIVFAVGFALATSAQAYQQPVPGAESVPSPLSGLDTVSEFPEYYSTEIPLTRYVTHEVDLGKALSVHSASQNCSMADAFLKLEKRLGMRHEGTAKEEGSNEIYPEQNAVFKIIGEGGKGIYSISAKQGFFNALPVELGSFQYGDKSIVVEVRFFELPQSDVGTLQSFMIPGTFEAFGNRLPVLEEFATKGTLAIQGNEAYGANVEPPGKSESSKGTFVRATETRAKAYPTFIGHLNERGAEQLVMFSKNRSSIGLLHAPSVTMFPGQFATVSDLSLRPFVVSVKKITGEKATAHRPVIQVVEDGVKIAIQADIVGDKLKLTGDLAFSTILGVETFNYPAVNQKDGHGVTVQVPENRIRKVHWTADIASGNSILIDSVETFEKEIKPKTRFKAAVTETMRRVVMISPRLIEQAEVAQKGTPQKLVK